MSEAAMNEAVPRHVPRLRLQPGEEVVYDCLPSALWTWSSYLLTFGLWAIWRRADRFVVTTHSEPRLCTPALCGSPPRAEPSAFRGWVRSHEPRPGSSRMPFGAS